MTDFKIVAHVVNDGFEYALFLETRQSLQVQERYALFRRRSACNCVSFEYLSLEHESMQIDMSVFPNSVG